jgi:hypothetical protein
MEVTRRSLLLGGLVVLASCSNKQATDKLVPVAGPDQQPGEPLWSAKTNSFVVGLTGTDNAALIDLGAKYVAAGASGFVAVLNQCTVSGTAKGTVGWCPSTDAFSCSECGSEWSRVGAVLQGPAMIGLTLLGVSVSATDDVVIDVRSQMPGKAAIASQLRTDLTCTQSYRGPGRIQ